MLVLESLLGDHSQGDDQDDEEPCLSFSIQGPI